MLWLGLVGVCPAQTILTPPANQTALVGSSVTFNVSATNSAIYTGGFNYGDLDGWPHTNVFYTGRTAGTLNFSYLFGSLNDRLTVYYGTNQIYDTGYIGGPNTRTYTTNYGPGTATSVTVIINEGNYDNHGSKWEYHLSMLAPIYYQWQFNSANIAGATNAAYTVNNITTLNAGTYRVVVADNFGPATNAAGTLTVLVPPSITQPPTSLTVLPGASTNFTVAATGDPPLAYQWRFFGTNLSGATTNRYSLSNIQTTNAGDYTVVITNASGSITSAVASLKVLVSPTLINVSGNATNFGFALPTVFGSTYVTQYKANLNDTNWTAIATNVGTGNLLPKNFTVNSALSNRFYRVLRYRSDRSCPFRLAGLNGCGPARMPPPET